MHHLSISPTFKLTQRDYDLSFVLFISSEKYVADAQNLHEHVMRLNHDANENGTSINCMKISFDHEYPFELLVYEVKHFFHKYFLGQ